MTAITVDSKKIDEIRIYRNGEWSALYIDGKLAYGPSDHYLIQEYLEGLFGIQVFDGDGDGDAYLGRPVARSNVAQTTDQIDRYEDRLRDQLEEAKRLLAERDEILAKVNRLDPKGRLPR